MATAPPVHRQLPLARLIDEVRSVFADRAGQLVAVRERQCRLRVMAASGGRADEVVREKATERATIDHRAGRGGGRESECREQDQADELDARLPALAARPLAHRGPRIRSQSRTRSTGLRQSFTIRRSSESGTGISG
jgi:hypothetical protein